MNEQDRLTEIVREVDAEIFGKYASHAMRSMEYAARLFDRGVRVGDARRPPEGPWRVEMVGNACGWRIIKAGSSTGYGALDDTISDRQAQAIQDALNAGAALVAPTEAPK